jgi:hypothetical protein
MPASYRDSSRQPQPAGLPDTAMAAAFLRALVRLAGAHHSKTEVTIPTGTVEIGELELVLCALGLIRNDRQASQ